jgi:hypothetical protein
MAAGHPGYGVAGICPWTGIMRGQRNHGRSTRRFSCDDLWSSHSAKRLPQPASTRRASSVVIAALDGGVDGTQPAPDPHFMASPSGSIPPAYHGRTGPSLSVVAGDNPSTDIDGSWDRADWQHMWLQTQSTEWRTLALVPGDDQTSTFGVANLIVRLALDHGESIHVADVRALRLKHVEAFLEGIRWEASKGTRVIFATLSASSSLVTVPVAQAADCAILCVSMRSTSLSATRSTVEQVGRNHFLGSLLVRGSSKATSSTRSLPRRSDGAKARR